MLLSKNPSVLDKYIEQTTDEFSEEARMQTRKRDSDDDEGAAFGYTKDYYSLQISEGKHAYTQHGANPCKYDMLLASLDAQ